MAGTITVDTIQSDTSYASTINVASKINFSNGFQVGGVDSSLSGFRNRLINGQMVIDQKNGGANTTPSSSARVVDKWVVSSSGKIKIGQNLNSITPPDGFSNYVGLQCTTTYTPAAGDIYKIGQSIEGINTADAMWGTARGKTMTLSFWVRSSITGTWGGSILDYFYNNYSYCFTYTINQADTWEFKTITISAPPVGTAWFTGQTSSGIEVMFGLGVGSTYSGTANSWVSGNKQSATGGNNLGSALNSTFYLTGVQFELGSVATPFEYRDIQSELARCQRYYWCIDAKSYSDGYQRFGVGFAESSTSISTLVQFPVPMCRQPTMTTTGSFTAYNGGFTSGITATDASRDTDDGRCLYMCVTWGKSGAGWTTGSSFHICSDNNNISKMEFTSL